MSAVKTLAPHITERELQDQVIELARLFGWRSAHFRPARTAYGWRTAVQGDGKGWPDLIALRGDRCIAAELKTTRGKLTAEQQAWLDDWRAVGAEVFVWTPADLEAIAEVLR